MKRNTEMLRWAGYSFLAGFILIVVGEVLDTQGRGDYAGAWLAIGSVLVLLSPFLLVIGAINYFRSPRNSEPASSQKQTSGHGAKNFREPVANWRRVVAWLVAIPVALIGLGFFTLSGLLPELPKGPADSEFVKVAAMHLVAVVCVGAAIYHLVLWIDIKRFLAWLKKKQ